MNAEKITKAAAALALAAAVISGAPTAQAGTRAADCASTAGKADVNGDGFDDVVVGDPFADVRGALGAGAVRILLGGADGPGTGGTTVLTAPDGKAGDGFGWAVRTAHLDDDRCLDIVVGAPYADPGGVTDAGVAYIFTGTADGEPTGKRIEAPRRREERAHFGWSLAAADGGGGEPSIVAVGAPHEDADGVKDSGAIYLRYAAGDGKVTTVPLTQENEGVIGNSEPGDMFGWSMVFGRLGGNGVQLDLAVGTPYEDVDGVGRQKDVKGIKDVGGVTVVHDVAHAADGVYTSGKWELGDSEKVEGNAGERLGYAVAYAEWKGEGYLAVGAPGVDVDGVADAGQVQLFKRGVNTELALMRALRPGNNGGLRSAKPVEGGRIGWSLAFWNPLDSLVLAIGAPYDSAQGDPTPESGVVRQVTVEGGKGADVVAERDDVQPYEHFGWTVADVGSEDGLAPGGRLFVGVPDERSSNGGAVALMEGATPKLFTPGRDDNAVAADFGSSIG
ncbi:hypothetical protein AB0K60_21740 [Thermopolyspora sp. NPDC052614]|uniref:hypothetical protein n=1 Tax=Thermopolyspora sp. NPDC052614 TaxID=3155682 RepID=UPI003418FCF2